MLCQRRAAAVFKDLERNAAVGCGVGRKGLRPLPAKLREEVARRWDRPGYCRRRCRKSSLRRQAASAATGS